MPTQTTDLFLLEDLEGSGKLGRRGRDGMKPAATDVQTIVIPGAGHWVANQAPEELVAALTSFLAKCREAATSRADAVAVR